MRKKLTIEFVRGSFEKEGYKLLTKKYINCEHRLEYICPKDHTSSITWNSWQQGQRCNVCAGRKPLTEKPKQRNFEIEFIKREFAKEGYTLLTKVYIDSKTHLDYICPAGNQNFTIWNNWQRGKRCACDKCEKYEI